MEVTSELLAAYAENNVTDEERVEIRKYLTEHPEEIESLLLMMDVDSEIEMDMDADTSPAPGKSSFPSFTGALGICHGIAFPCNYEESSILPRMVSCEDASRRIAGRLDVLMEEMEGLD